MVLTSQMFKILGYLVLLTTATLTVTLTTISTAIAMNYSGVVVSTSPKKLRIKEARIGKTFELTYEDSIVGDSVKKLKVNDFISFEGARSPSVSAIRVDSINYVGLSQLIDTWLGDDNYCYRFTTFNELEIFPMIARNCLNAVMTSRKYAYTISPSGEDWLLLLSDNQANYVADLSLKTKRNVELSLYDSNTGLILKEIKLRK